MADDANEGPLPEGGETDPFEGLTLDEDFVRGAALVEDSAEERLARLARIEAEHRRLAQEREVQRAALDKSLRRQARRSRRSGSEGRRRALVIGLMAVVFAGLVMWNTRNPGGEVAIGTGGLFGDASAGSVSGFERPPPGVDSATEPLGEPAPLARESSAYTFIATQEGSEEPVAYDPCRPIHVVVNGRTAFIGSDEMIQASLASLSRATGLQLVYDGTTEEVPSQDRSPYQPDRYGERWAPLLISWSGPAETPELEGDTAGLGGSSYVTVDRGSVYVTGSIELDGPQLAEIRLGPEGVAGARSVIEHELGHVVGLDHVEDPSQLMNPVGGSVTTFADGDLTGLARLGRGECFPSV